MKLIIKPVEVVLLWLYLIHGTFIIITLVQNNPIDLSLHLGIFEINNNTKELK